MEESLRTVGKKASYWSPPPPTTTNQQAWCKVSLPGRAGEESEIRSISQVTSDSKGDHHRNTTPPQLMRERAAVVLESHQGQHRRSCAILEVTLQARPCPKPSAALGQDGIWALVSFLSPQIYFLINWQKASSSLKGSKHFSRAGIRPVPYEFIN